MPVTCSTVDAPALVRYVFQGDWTASQLVERRRELVRAGQLTTDSGVLFDLRGATSFPRSTDLYSAIQATTQDHIWPVCRAFLVTTEEQYQCAGQLQKLLGPHVVINAIFQDETIALEWLSAMAGRGRMARV
jgi:hypothetical protein